MYRGSRGEILISYLMIVRSDRNESNDRILHLISSDLLVARRDTVIRRFSTVVRQGEELKIKW